MGAECGGTVAGRRVSGGVICAVGDLNLDVVVCPSRPVEEETDTDVRTWVGAGGQAANVTAWIVALGGRARLVAARAADPAGRLVAGELARRGVDLAGPVMDGRTGVVVSLSDHGNTRSMLTDRGVGPRLAAAALRASWFGGCTRLHLPAYSLVSAPIRAAALAAAEYVPRLSVDLSSTAVLRDIGAGPFRELLGRLRPDVVFGNEAEAELVADLMAELMAELPGTDFVVKLGPRGVRAAGVLHQALPTDAVDSTGAGDAFAAGYLLGGVNLGLRAAARAVARMGAMP
jgi:sugar/nucleoside kinase (ribokinase family)